MHTQQRNIEDIRVPVKKLEEDEKGWALAFEFIQHPFVRVDVANNEGLNFQVGLTEVHWIFGLHYVFKYKWDSKHKIPVKLKPTSQRAFRLWGEYLYTILELCVQCHASPSTQVSYHNAAKWFELVAWEMKTSDLNAALLAKKGLKKQSVDQGREALKALKEYKNPVDPKTHPHAFALVKSALDLAQKDVFYKKYWKPFTTAYAKLLRDIESNPTWQTVFEKDGSPYVQAGRGNRIVVYLGFKKRDF